MPLDSLFITVQINKWEHGDSVRFLIPPVYADNPMLDQTGNNFCNMSIMSAGTSQVAYSTDSIQVGPYKNAAIAFSASDLPVTIKYYVKFMYNKTGNAGFVPVPVIGIERGYLQGNYLFITPFYQRNLTNIWRDRFNLYVHYAINKNLPFHGDPTPVATFENPYELMFSTSVLGGEIFLKGESNGQSYVYINYNKENSSTAETITETQNASSLIFADIASLFGPLQYTGQVSVILGSVSGYSGFEGTNAFSVFPPFPHDTSGIFNMVLAHEMIHSWIGIRVGDYDDPWWKEGTTSYLGFLIAKRNGLCSRSYIEESFLQDLSNDNGVLNHCLSDEYVRINIFSPDSLKNCVSLVYGKGAQVCMLMDRKIREASKGETTLPRILADFVKIYSGSAFHRSDYLGFIETCSTAKVDDIFSMYVDNTGPIPDSVLLNNYNALLAMGAFGNEQGTAKYMSKKDNSKNYFPW